MAVLYVTATPIGNLNDFSPRGVETLKNADLIVAEDTRVTMKLAQVYGFHARMVSCHRHNEGEKAETLAERIEKEDLNAALVTDAGTPCISDPGNELVRACVERGIPVIPVPGCCAGIAAISVSGFDAREFTFYGFLPRERKDLREKLEEIARGAKVAVIHESPYRIIDLTEAVREVIPRAQIAVCCDLTKLHEKTIYGTPDETLRMLKENEKTEKGEYCVVIDLHGAEPETEAEPETALSVEAKLAEEISRGRTLREAQEALIGRGEKKNAVKQAALHLKRICAE